MHLRMNDKVINEVVSELEADSDVMSDNFDALSIKKIQLKVRSEESKINNNRNLQASIGEVDHSRSFQKKPKEKTVIYKEEEGKKVDDQE